MLRRLFLLLLLLLCLGLPAGGGGRQGQRQTCDRERFCHQTPLSITFQRAGVRNRTTWTASAREHEATMFLK